MGYERWFRGQHDGQGRPFDWRTVARQHGIPDQTARAMYERAMQQAHGAGQGRVQEVYLALLADARPGIAQPSPGKVTRVMRLQAHRAGKRRAPDVSYLTGHAITPGKRPLTRYLEPASAGRSPAEDEHEALDDLARPEQARPEQARPERSWARRVPGQDPLAPDTLSASRLQAHLAIAFGHLDDLDELDEERAAGPASPTRASLPGDRDRDTAASPRDPGASPRGALPFRDEMERLFGERLDDILVEHASGLPRGALAAAERGRIRFADATPSKVTVAHEVAHVLQHRRGAPHTTARLGERSDPAEREARRAAADVLAGRSVQIRGAPTAQMHLQEPTEAGEEEEPILGITAVHHAVDFARRGDGLQVEVWWYALLWQEGLQHRPLLDGELPPQFAAPRLRATRLIQRLEEHTGRRMLPAGRQALLRRREIPLTQRDPYSYTADLSADDLRQWFGDDAWQAFLEGRPTDSEAAAPAGDTTPAVTVEEVLRHLAEGSWDVDSLAAQLTDAQMNALSSTDRVRLFDHISGGSFVLNEDEHTIVRLLATTPAAQARVVRDQLGTELLQQLDGAIDFDDFRDYNEALRQLFFDSLAPEEADAQMAGARVFPWANPGIIHALWNVRFAYDECELHDDGKVHISYWITIAGLGLRTETVQLDPFEMIAVRFHYPEEYAGAEVGQTIYMPAINLRNLHRHQFKGDLQTAVDVALLAAGGAGLVGAGTRLARIIAALDLAVAAADLTIRDFRHEIARLEHGRDFLAAWDVVSTLIAAYGVVRLVTHAPAAIARLRSAFARFRGARPSLPAQTMQRIESEVDDVLRQADESEAAAAAGGHPGQTSGADDALDTSTGQPAQTSGADDALDTSTGQPAQTSADAGDAARLDDAASQAVPISGFSATESAVIREARSIMESSDMARIRAAHESRQSVTVTIDGRVIQYEPDLPASGMTMFGEDGFLIGREAFASEAELAKTVLHELHRLATSQSSGGVSGNLAAEETIAAATFAERAFKVLFQ